MSSPDQKTVDENYRRKLEARAKGTTPVLIVPPAAQPGLAPEAIDSRYQAKIAARSVAAIAPVAAAAHAPIAEATEPTLAAAESEPKKPESADAASANQQKKGDRR
jgi:hypothetical protein